MKLYLMRHGIALELAEAGVASDEERPLSPKGRKKTRQVAQGLATLDVRPEVVASSPLLRARETAEIVADVLDARIDLCPALAPGGKIKDLVEWLEEAAEDTILAAGHMPDLAETLSYLISGDARARFEFKKAAVALVEFDGRPRIGAGTLAWLLPPAVLRALGEEA